MKRLSNPNKTVLSQNRRKKPIFLSFKDSPMSPLKASPNACFAKQQGVDRIGV